MEEDWITRSARFAFAASAALTLMLYMAQHCLKCEARNHFNHMIYRETERGGYAGGSVCGTSALHPDPDACLFPE